MSTESVETPTNEAPAVADDASVDDVATSAETVPSGSEDSEINLDKYPKEVQDQLRPFVDKINKDFKRTYTKKFEDLSAKERQWQAQQTAIAEQYEALRQQAMDVLRDPSKLDAYRKLYADQIGQQPQPPSSEGIQTVDDLIKYTDAKIADIARGLEQRIAGQAYQTISQTQATQRWETALEKVKATEPRFGKYEQVVATMVRSDPTYRALYRGNNEYEVLTKAYNDFKALMREELDTVKQETLQSVKAKKSATTFTPTKPVGVDTQPRNLSPDEIIERVRARLGK